MTKIDQKRLNPKQEMFCQLFASDREFFGNGVQSYIEAYAPDQSKLNWYKNARSAASELLTKPNILHRIDEIFEAHGLNDQFVDKQLEKLITQDADFTNKMSAIKEYNKLRQRITDRISLDIPKGIQPLFDRSDKNDRDDCIKKDSTAKEAN